jgi:hypothetical protein
MLVHYQCLIPITWKVSNVWLETIGTHCEICNIEVLDDEDLLEVELEELLCLKQ